MATYRIELKGTNAAGEPVTDTPEINGSLAAGSWDEAIRTAWFRLGPTGSGWDDATVTGPSNGIVVRLTAADKAAYLRGVADRVRAIEAEQAAAEAAGEPTVVLGGDDDD